MCPHQVLVLVLWTVEGRGGMSPLGQDRVPDPPEGLFHPPPSGGIVRPTNECRENVLFRCPSVSPPFPGAVPRVTHAPAWDGTWGVGTALAWVLRGFDPADRRHLVLPGLYDKTRELPAAELAPVSHPSPRGPRFQPAPRWCRLLPPRPSDPAVQKALLALTGCVRSAWRCDSSWQLLFQD